MDWYPGAVIDDFVVPKDGELSDRLPSPKSWPKWGLSSHESIAFANRCSVMDMTMTRDAINFNGEFSSNDVGMGGHPNDGDQCSSFNGGGRMPGNSLNQDAFTCDQQDYCPDWLARIEEMDGLFLSSLLEDLPGIVSLNKSLCIYPESQSNMVPADSILTEMDVAVDSGSISDAHSFASPKYIKPCAFSTSVSWEEGEVPASGFIAHNLEQKDCEQVKALPVNVLASTEHNCTNVDVDGQNSIQESVLQELEMVMSQLTYKIRICFRDALYRMAKNSREHAQDETEGLSEGPPLWTIQDEETRSEGKMITELETNAIDRAVANVMFNKVDLNLRHFPPPASVYFEQEIVEATGPTNYSLNQSQIQGLRHHPAFPADAVVPVFDKE